MINYKEEGAQLTHRIQSLLEEVSRLSELRRAVWYEGNKVGVSQPLLASAAGVVTHTVYCEIRKHKELAKTG